jgi:uncharacterized protein YbjT (DUF2867 family)
MSQPVLVAGATGQLGRVIVQKLLATGVPVRALARDPAKLQALGEAGADVAAVNMLDLHKLTEACRGVGDIIATANNNMGKGATSPMRVDLTGYQNLCAAARNTGVRRIIFVSFRGVTPDQFVDIFRLKWLIEDAIKRSRVPHVILRPSAFTDIWVDELLAGGIRKKGVATIFGDGSRVSNYISVNDVAEFAVRVVQRPDVVNEVIDLGGPSNKTLHELASLLEARFQSSGKRSHVPVAAMRLLPPIVRPFNEVAARLMTLGLYAATQSTPFPDWKRAADRFGVTPESVEDYVSRMNIGARPLP